MSLHPLNAADTVADAGAFFERFARESAAARAERPGLCNLQYGDDPMETLDFFSAGAGAPLAIFIHGGYWRRLDKADFSYIAQGLVPLGISFASINYGLAPATSLRTMVEQCRRAVNWMRSNTERLQIDPARISVFGHSAGGHLAAMCGVEIPVHAVATISGLHELVQVQQSFVNEWLGLDEREARALSPVSYPPARPFALYATAGARESEDGFKAQGRALVDAWTPYGCAAEYEDSPGDDHFTIVLRLLSQNDPLTKKIADLAR
ncbi:MAG: alpha/beta hydrolase [Candidatus Velthaea sp.]